MIEQRSPEWYQARVGKITASRFKDVMDRTQKGLPGARRTAYMRSLLAERMTGAMVDNYANDAMKHGIETEPLAIEAYESTTAQFAEEAGFYLHPRFEFVGASPDRLVGDDTLVEVKCPSTQTHLETIANGMSEDHKPQIQGQLWVTGRKLSRLPSFFLSFPLPWVPSRKLR